MKALIVFSGSVLGHGYEVDRAMRPARPVNHGSGGDADIRRHLAAAVIVAKRFPGEQGSGLPEHIARRGVEGVHAVIFSDNIQNVMRTLSGDRYVREVERLGIDQAVHGEESNFSKSCG